MNDLTAARLRELLHYDPQTGVFTRTSGLKRRGRIAGSVYGDGYGVISVDGHRHLAHRLAWLYVTGSWPAHGIDHIDGDKANNRFANLRDVTQRENTQNQRRAHRRNRTGILGVTISVCKEAPRYRAALAVDGRVKYLGTFPTTEQAQAVYLEAKRQLHAGCTI